MKKIRLTALFSAFVSLTLLCSCGGAAVPEANAPEASESLAAEEKPEKPSESEALSDSAESSNTAAEEAAAAPDLSAMSESELHDYIVKRALISTGSSERVKKVLDRAKNGEAITVAYIGGSITEGIAVDRSQCWARLNCDYITELFPTAEVNYVNAGMSGTPSMLGTIRCERDVIAPYGDPDLVFIEFAVNDAQDSNSKEAYESLVRRFLMMPNEPAVALIFMRTDTGYSCEKHMSDIGYYYGLPMISVNGATTEAFDAGVMQWSDYSDDGAHPNLDGNRLAADMLNYFIDTVMSGAEVKSGRESEAAGGAVSDIKPLIGDAYVNMHMLDRTNLTPVSLGEYDDVREAMAWFPNGWSRKGGENEGITFDITCKSLYIVYHCNKSKKYGTAEVYVDGEMRSEVRGYAADGWSNPVPQLVIKSDELKDHHIEIKMAEGSEDTYFGILCFGYTD